MSNINKAVHYANFHYYSKPLSVVNLRKLQIPYPVSLKKIQHKREDVAIQKEAGTFETYIRLSHGMPHASAAMESITQIDQIYTKYDADYDRCMLEICEKLGLGNNIALLLEMVQIATLFHDTGRLGDGMDLWDEDSGNHCEEYFREIYLKSSEFKKLSSEQKVKLAKLFGDAVRFKDNQATFMDLHAAIHPEVDYISQLINMADTLEVIRTRDDFNPSRLPIAKRVSSEVMIKNIIPELVIPHRDKIIEEGRLSRKGRIVYPGFDDSQYMPKPGYNDEKIAASYFKKMQQYDAIVLKINETNIDEVISRTLQGIKDYIKDYQNHSGFQFAHDGFFSARYHGKLGVNRALFYQRLFESGAVSMGTKVLALHTLLISRDGGRTLKDYVYRGMNQRNSYTVIEQLCTHLSSYGAYDSVQAASIADFANGKSKMDPLPRLEGRRTGPELG